VKQSRSTRKVLPRNDRRAVMCATRRTCATRMICRPYRHHRATSGRLAGDWRGTWAIGSRVSLRIVIKSTLARLLDVRDVRDVRDADDLLALPALPAPGD